MATDEHSINELLIPSGIGYSECGCQYELAEEGKLYAAVFSLPPMSSERNAPIKWPSFSIGWVGACDEHAAMFMHPTYGQKTEGMEKEETNGD